MITKINIQGYKSIREQSIALRSINLLIGGNGVGKSNFISIFSLLRNIYERNLKEYVIKRGGADSFLHFGKKNTNSINLNLCFDDTNQFLIDLQESQDSLIIGSTKTAFNSHGKWHYQVHEENLQESKFRYKNSGQAFWVNPYLNDFEVYHFHDTSSSSPMKSKCSINDNKFLKKDASNISAFLFLLKKKHYKYFLRIEKTIQSIAPFFDGFELEPDRLNENLIQLEWKEKGSYDSYFNAYHLSDGTLRFICLVTLLMQPNPPRTIIIDEPELGLHPVAINKLASIIQKTSRNVQLIISTQSVDLLDNFNPDDIIVADRCNAQTEFRRLSNEDLKGWLEEYTLGDIWGKNVIGGQPF